MLIFRSLKSYSTIQCSLNFLIMIREDHVLPLWARSLKIRPLVANDLLNIRNIFRVAFLSGSHIRLEMFFRSLQGRSSYLCRRAFVLRDNFLTLSQLSALVNNFFKKFFQSCVTGVLGDKKMKRTISPSRNRFISSS